MLDVNSLVKSYGPTSVLNSVSFAVNRGERAGLVGANGVGKSTLLRILAGEESADSGLVSWAPSTIAGYLTQTPLHFSGQTIDDLILESIGGLRQLADRMRQIEQAMATAARDEQATLMGEYGELSARFEERGGYEVEHRVDSVLQGLGIGYLERTRSTDTLSGGERTRVSLATLLLKSPDLLLLDEPTNHLDLPSLEWLESYLATYKGAVIAASHDRQFLNHVATEILEIDEYTHRLRKYPGNYDAYRTEKAAERVTWEEDYQRQQEEITQLSRVIRTTGHSPGRSRPPRDHDKYARYFKEQRKQQSASRTIRAAQERLRRIQEDPVPRPPRPLRFKAAFRSNAIRSAEAIRAVGVTKSYGARCILREVSLTLGPDSRTVIIGPNGSGKTTFLRILAGEDTPDDGKVASAPNARIGSLHQEPQPADTEATVLESFRRGLPGREEDFVSELLRSGLFRRDDIEKAVGQLSLGQVRKLELARMIAEEPNILILDEPTNYVSLDVLEALESAVADFQGPVLSVSHDRRFLQRFGGEMWVLDDGGLTYLGREAVT